MTVTRLWVLALAIGIAGFVVAGSASSSEASGRYVPAAGHLAQPVPAKEDFCGNEVINVPDSGPFFDFTKACYNHDECYADSPQGPAARAACDMAFSQQMRASCSEMWPSWIDPRLYKCDALATLYYEAVRAGGWLFFYQTMMHM
jgi:hypothetical protein